MKQLTDSLSVVTFSLLMSSVLEVDTTQTRLRNRQVEEMPEYAETLPRTVCVENLRVTATIETVEGMMKPFGHPVCYVQIPTVKLLAVVMGVLLMRPQQNKAKLERDSKRERERERE